MSSTMFSKLKPSRKATSTTVDIPQPAKYTNPLQTISCSSTKILGGSEPKGGHVAEHTASSTSSSRSTFNVVLFGETGVGKSSVINLVARKEIAAVPSDVNGCMMQYKHYDIPFDDVNFAIYDTVALEEPQIGVNGYLEAIKWVYGLIHQLSAAGGIHLLLFCLRGGRVTATAQSNYLLFRECLCYGGVPTALVFTGLEREVEMEDWWRRNKKHIEDYGIKSDGHACITVVQDDEDDHKFLASQVRIRQLLECALKHDPVSPGAHPWFARFTRGMKDFIRGKVPKKKIIRVLMQCFKLDQKTARKVAAMLKNGDVETNKAEDSQERSGDNEPRKEPETNATTDHPSLRERADLLAGNRVGGGGEGTRTIPNDEVEQEAVPTKDNSPPTWYEGLQAGDRECESGDWEELAIDESMLNARDQKDQQGITKGEQTETESSSIDLTDRVTKSSQHPFASGSYGDIYKGIYHSGERPIDVAIKTTRMYLHHDQQLPRNMKRFRREVAVWWGLKHPNVLPFLGTIMDPSTNPIIPAMVCPLAENGPLTVYLVEKSDLTFAKRLFLIDNVAHGLQYLHSRQIVHGDLSGSNVFINGEGTACIADFGLSTLLTRLGGSTFATNYHARGTLRWIAPELFDINDHNIIPTTQGDVYSFGCIMLQILTGNIPYHYLCNDPQVTCAIVTGTKPARPDSEVIDDNKWKFIEWCWSPVKVAKPRPSSDQIVEFTEMELANTAKSSANADSLPNENGQGNKA